MLLRTTPPLQAELVQIVSPIGRGLVAAAENRLTALYDPSIGESYDFNTVVKLLNDALETDIEPVYVDNPIPE